MNLSFELDGEAVSVEIAADVPLIDVVRALGRLGPKDGCGVGACGLCTVVVDELPISACIYLAACVQGSEVWTVEGLVELEPGLAECFIRNQGLQCGICTPGQVVAAWGFRKSGVDPSPRSVRRFMAGNLCRCTGYQTIVDAVRDYRGQH